MTKPILIGIASICVLGVVYWVLAWRDDVNLARAKEMQLRADQALSDKQKSDEQARQEREAHEEERKQWQEQQTALTRNLLARNAETERRIAAALAPKPAEQVKTEAEQAFGKPAVQTPQGFTVSVEQMQEFVALKLDRDRLSENLKETQKQLDIERQGTATLRADLERSIKSLDQANKVIVDYQAAMAAYRKAATKTKLRKILEFSGRAGITVGLAYLGAKAGSK